MCAIKESNDIYIRPGNANMIATLKSRFTEYKYQIYIYIYRKDQASRLKPFRLTLDERAQGLASKNLIIYFNLDFGRQQVNYVHGCISDLLKI